MAKKPDPGCCVHCLQFHDELTWDHVFPESWYPGTTPEDLEKWKIPACLPCNKDYGRIEEDLLIKLGLCIDPKNPRGAGIAFKTVRALRSDFGRNDRNNIGCPLCSVLLFNFVSVAGRLMIVVLRL